MPRPPRIHVPDGVYHVVLRGNHRQRIFFAPANYHHFEKILAESLDACRCRLHAYCWMTNHIHMAIQVSDRPLGPLMQVVASRYARHMQCDIPTTGHFFERRYRANLVGCDAYLLELARYIHLNPLRAGMVRTAVDYPWSSHAAYLGSAAPAWLTMDLIQGLFGEQAQNSRAGYRRFMAVTPDPEEMDRVRQGWPDKAMPGVRIPGIGPTLPVPPPTRRSLAGIIDAELARRGIALADLTGPGKLRALSVARAEIARLALREGAATLTEIAAAFNRSVPALSRLVRKLPNAKC